MGLFEGYDREKAEKEGSFGGEMKYRDITYGHPTVELLDRNTPLAKLLDDLAKILQRHYLAVEPKCQGPIPARTSTAALSTAGAFVDGLRRAAAKAALGNPKAPAPSTAVLQPVPELMDHQKVLDAFLAAVTGDQIAWQALKKTSDQFEPFKNSAVMQRTRELRSYQSSGSKRGSEDDLILQDAAQADRLKRARNETTGLSSVSEEHEVSRDVD
ncbi:hypothetical protein FOMPIDRAFT_1019677 [Fomitopsis schrenkii]|uniref:Uncharacterized protein n=1 Tax=Fomitopsis schrenkii TaxID=2126942 RepID=S8F8K0_FOMSC|nr:hypothetical protein FOMPIDRAFT_1019677 [Fomitopsis schrenkii]